MRTSWSSQRVSRIIPGCPQHQLGSDHINALVHSGSGTTLAPNCSDVLLPSLTSLNLSVNFRSTSAICDCSNCRLMESYEHVYNHQILPSCFGFVHLTAQALKKLAQKESRQNRPVKILQIHGVSLCTTR